jgi:thiamine-phosphate diphosphorylase
VQPVICLITDRRRVGNDDHLIELVRAAARAGVHLVQVRERDLETRDLLRLVSHCLDAVRGTAARVVVNDRLDVALAAGAHGVHLRADSVAPSRVRAVVPRGFLVGASVHSVEEAVESARGADYLIAGTIFETASKPGAERVGLAHLRGMAAAVPIPVLAIGGISLDRVASVAAAGASGIAAIGLFSDIAPPTEEKLRNVVQIVSQAFDTTSAVP